LSEGIASARYARLQATRQPYLDMARKCATLTIPALFPPEGLQPGAALPSPYQSIGARGLNNIAAKLLISQFPPNVPFFKLAIDEMTLEELTKQQGMKAEVDRGLAKIVRKVIQTMDAEALRVSFYEAFRLLAVSGNVLLYLPPSGGLRVFRLDKYVVKRSPDGTVLEIVVKEAVARETLPEKVRAAVDVVKPADAKTPEVDTVDVYTYVQLEGPKKRYKTHQEIEGIVVPGSIGTFPTDKTPWIAVRWMKVDGEDYGRGFVEEYIGDLATLETQSKALDDAAQIAARIINLIKPGATVRPDDLTGCVNGGFVVAEHDAVKAFQVEKYADFRVTLERVAALEQRLSFAFLLNTAIQRNGERVTAEEIRFMARELDDAMGGIYSLMSVELQLPFINRRMFQLQKQGELPPLPPEIKPAVVTGLEAIGRGQDLDRLDALAATVQIAPQLAQYIDWQDYLTRRAVALGIEIDGLLLSKEEVQAQQQQAMLMQLAEKLGPNAINQMGGMAQKQMETSNSA